ncbi:hypothetical protein ABZZ04_20425 [Streptomyces sp. NPDC006435]|uniref:hypothetical protein n=1 Tax=Streptomyces sp. NPDC006435 TaxID=3154300 RepID=UPI0033AF9A51
MDRVTRVWAGFWAGRAVPVGAAVDEEEGDGVAESREERVVETGAPKSECRAVNASQTRETDIAAPIPTVTVPMSSAGDCFRLLVERRADLRTAGAGRDGDDGADGMDGTDCAGIPGRGAVSSKDSKDSKDSKGSKSSISVGRAP